MTEVLIYKNIRTGKYSIQSKGLVVGARDYILVQNVSFIVRKGGREKVLSTGTKNVHAFVKGKITKYKKLPENALKIRYNPYVSDCFHFDLSKEPVFSANQVWLTPNGVFISNE